MIEYTPTSWEDRNVENPRNYSVTENDDGTITLTPVPGTVTNEGTKVSATRLNNIENGISTCVEAINTNYESIQSLNAGLSLNVITDDETFVVSDINLNDYFYGLTETGYYYLTNNDMFMLVLNHNDTTIFQYLFAGSTIYIMTYQNGEWDSVWSSIEGGAG